MVLVAVEGPGFARAAEATVGAVSRKRLVVLFGAGCGVGAIEVNWRKGRVWDLLLEVGLLVGLGLEVRESVEAVGRANEGVGAVDLERGAGLIVEEPGRRLVRWVEIADLERDGASLVCCAGLVVRELREVEALVAPRLWEEDVVLREEASSSWPPRVREDWPLCRRSMVALEIVLVFLLLAGCRPRLIERVLDAPDLEVSAQGSAREREGSRTRE